MAKIKIEYNEIVKVFTEWDRRYRANPDDFYNSVQHLLQNTPDTYGAGAAVCFTEILKEVRKKPVDIPWEKK
ncbi:MAG: hypothetical protein KC517_09305 [Bacteroidetes bacterium]|nr:hypothetical protein [Bacteroidota bacterium]